MIRIVSKVSFDSHTNDLFNEHKILKFSNIYFQIIFAWYCLLLQARYINICIIQEIPAFFIYLKEILRASNES